jgi:hypothetical protein
MRASVRATRVSVGEELIPGVTPVTGPNRAARAKSEIPVIKTMRDLRKRTGSIRYGRDGGKMDATDALGIGDIATVFHASGRSASIRMDTIRVGGSFIGTVLRSDSAIPGVVVGQAVVGHLDFVHLVLRIPPRAATVDR